MDGTFLASGLFARFKKNKSAAAWEAHIQEEIARLTESMPSDLTILIPALQIELGSRLEFASKLLKEKGYRLRQVIPDSGTTWAASFMRID